MYYKTVAAISIANLQHFDAETRCNFSLWCGSGFDFRLYHAGLDPAFHNYEDLFWKVKSDKTSPNVQNIPDLLYISFFIFEHI